MNPYYQDDYATIYHGDCVPFLGRRMLPPIDILLTDPPYGIAYRSNRRKNKHEYIVGDSVLPAYLIGRFVPLARRASYVFCRWNNLTEMPIPKSFLVWDKGNHTAGDLKHEHGRRWEGVCFYPGPDHEFIRRTADILRHPKASSTDHPTAKPVGLLVNILAANVGDVVLDPFMGSGSALLAARNLGRRSIGIEVEEKYCEIAAQRLQQEVLGF